jgi:hypothetical protein
MTYDVVLRVPIDILLCPLVSMEHWLHRQISETLVMDFRIANRIEDNLDILYADEGFLAMEDDQDDL